MKKAMLYDVDVSYLQKLDTFVGNPAALDAALGTKLDALGDEERFINAARALFGKDVEATLGMLREGQPGYRYAEKFTRMVTMHHKTAEARVPGPEPDDAIAPAPKAPNLTAGKHAEQPQQPL